MTIVETQYGKVEGFEAEGLQTFKGIPFAAAPVGELRWRPPADPTAWSGIREAKSFGPQSCQMLRADNGPLGFVLDSKTEADQDEDCLHLNVFTPGCDAHARPVMAWIHGGGFQGGTAGIDLYDGGSLARRGDVVVVTLNYRLGALGFLALDEVTGGRIPSTGNEGVLDQRKALEWIRDNIAAFGGDPTNVTVFGESAGAISLGSLMAMPSAKGLFRRAIALSGACSTFVTREAAAATAEGVLRQLDLDPRSDVHKIVGLEPSVITQAAARYAAASGGNPWGPCVDGDVLPLRPLDAIRDGSAEGIDVLAGTNLDEWNLMLAFAPPFELDDDALTTMLSASISEPRIVVEAYREARRRRGAPIDAKALLVAIETDRVFRLPAIHLSEALSQREHSSYQYLFTWESPYGGGGLGSCHSIGIGFVFGTHGMSKGSSEFFGSGPDAEALTDTVQDAWLAFAHTGNPATQALAHWTPYDTQKRTTAVLGRSTEIASAPLEDERAVWSTVEASLGSL